MSSTGSLVFLGSCGLIVVAVVLGFDCWVGSGLGSGHGGRVRPGADVHHPASGHRVRPAGAARRAAEPAAAAVAALRTLPALPQPALQGSLAFLASDYFSVLALAHLQVLPFNGANVPWPTGLDFKGLFCSANGNRRDNVIFFFYFFFGVRPDPRPAVDAGPPRAGAAGEGALLDDRPDGGGGVGVDHAHFGGGHAHLLGRHHQRRLVVVVVGGGVAVGVGVETRPAPLRRRQRPRPQPQV